MGIAVRELGHEQIIPDQQRVLHRAGRDIEGLEQQRANDKRDDERMHDHPCGFCDAAFLPLYSRSHAHLPLIPSFAGPVGTSNRWADAVQ